jgi:hypothetical protein
MAMGAGSGDGERERERMCAVTRVAGPPAALIRFVRGPDGILVPDIKAKLPGRGAWIACRRPILDEAIRRKAFARSLKTEVAMPADLPDLVDRLLSVDARQSLSLANKAGLVVTGFAKVEAALARGGVAALVSASDGAEDSRRKLAQAARRAAENGAPPPHVALLAGSDLDLALGRENAIHAALLAGPASDAFLARCARLAEFRSGAPVEARPDADPTSVSTGPFALGNH